MTAVMTHPSGNPAQLGYPPTLPIELALREHTPQDICSAYGIDQAEWDRLRVDPIFIADVKRCVEELRKDGMSFKVKARLQSEALLHKSWELIHADSKEVPPAVKADLIKSTWRVAGLDESKNAAANAGMQNALQININLA